MIKLKEILTEAEVSRELWYHINNNISLEECVFRYGSPKYFTLMNEARLLACEENIEFEPRTKALLETDLGKFGVYEGKEVALDFPMINEEEYYVTVNRGPKGGKSLVRSAESEYEEPRVFSKEEAEEYVKRVKSSGATPGQIASYWVSDRDMNRINEEKKLTYNDFVRMVRDDMMAGAAPDEKPSDKQVASRAKSLYNDYLQGASVDDLFEAKSLKKGDIIKFKNGERIRIIGPKGDGYDYQDGKEKGHHPKGWFDMMISSGKAVVVENKKKKDPPIGKPKRGGSKAYYVYVRDPKTKRIKKVTFGSGGLRAKINNPKARNAFAKRHRCSTATDRTTARYWSCRLPRYAKQLGIAASNPGGFW